MHPLDGHLGSQERLHRYPVSTGINSDGFHEQEN